MLYFAISIVWAIIIGVLILRYVQTTAMPSGMILGGEVDMTNKSTVGIVSAIAVVASLALGFAWAITIPGSILTYGVYKIIRSKISESPKTSSNAPLQYDTIREIKVKTASGEKTVKFRITPEIYNDYISTYMALVDSVINDMMVTHYSEDELRRKVNENLFELYKRNKK